MIYFDNAATTLKKPDGVAQAVSDAIMNLGNAGRGAYDASLHSMRMAYETRELLNELLMENDWSRLRLCLMQRKL